jgi:hypothetical protein
MAGYSSRRATAGAAFAEVLVDETAERAADLATLTDAFDGRAALLAAGRRGLARVGLATALLCFFIAYSS